MGGCSRVIKALFGALALVGFIWLLSVGILETGGTNTMTRTTKTGRMVNSGPGGKRTEMIGREKVAVRPHRSDLNYMSKRRVPNGPDPIHNRRTGNSHQPPGQA
ncbi:hypothetical protein U1Q18_016961 [Sarracenia purpurea var. burkii]